MNTHRLTGDITTALSHFAAWGLASILTDMAVYSGSGDLLAKTSWSDETQSVPHLHTVLSGEEVGDVVRAHAERHTRSSSWVQAKVREGVRAGSGLFSPRLKAAPLEEVGPFEAERAHALSVADDAGELTALDWAMLAGLGEPAWWRCSPKESQPDAGASRWEMKTRNRGEEFVGNRLGPLAECVALRSAGLVWDGISGGALVDDLAGTNAMHSRTPTGLAEPGPADSAVAWCALWAISIFPTVHLSTTALPEGGMSQSPAAWPRHRVHPSVACLPIYVSPVSPTRVRSIVMTSAFDVAAFGGLRSLDEDVPRAKAWLANQGVRGLARFPIHVGGSSSAPERFLLTGAVEPL